MKSSIYAGKPVCTLHLQRQYAERAGLVTAQHKTPEKKIKLTGLPVGGAPGYRPGPVTARTAERIARMQPGGAIIVWQDPKCEYAHVYSREGAR